MADVLNLNRVRKRKKRADARAQGDANAAKFGRSKVEREVLAAQTALEEAKLDGARRIRPHDPKGDSTGDSTEDESGS